MTGQLTNLLSFRRIADTPFDTYMAALDSWQLTRHDGELRLGNSLLRGPIERDRHFGTCRIQVRLARRPLRPPVRPPTRRRPRPQAPRPPTPRLPAPRRPQPRRPPPRRPVARSSLT